MTRANTEQQKYNPWFAKAGAACSIVPISRFVGPNIFALKGGGYGCLLSLTGLDEEALTDLELEARVRQVEGALRGLPEGSCLYQYTRVMSGFDLPRQKQYRNEVTETFAIYAGAVICFGGLIFAGIRMMSGRFQDAIPGLFGALFGAGVLGWGAGWIGSLTGQSM